MEGKICTKCDSFKNLNEYFKDKTKKDGLYSSCKMCVKHEHKIYKSINHTPTNRTCKKCSKCKLILDINIFSLDKTRGDGYMTRCKLCSKQNSIIYKKNNREKIKKYENSPERLESKKKALKRMVEKDPDCLNRYRRNKYRDDINHKLRTRYRGRINDAFLRKTKNFKTLSILGCSISEFKNYIESKFLPTMTWKNYGKYWHIDHIIPCAKFDLGDYSNVIECFHYSNHQPLFAKTTIIDGVEYIGNLNKGSKIIT